MRVARVLPRFRAAHRALDALAARETWSREQIEALQLARLNAVWRHALRHVPHYRSRIGSGLPGEFSSLEHFTTTVPLLTKAHVREHRRALRSDAAGAGAWHSTSGSTGAPTAVFRSSEAHLEMLRARYRFYQTWGLEIFDRTAFLWGRGAASMGGVRGWAAACRQRAEDRLRGRLRLSAYHLGHDDLREHLARLEAFRPAAIYGLAQAVYLLAAEARTVGFRCDSLKVTILTSEAATERMLATVGESFGAPATIEYGATEIPFIAGRDADGSLRVREDLVLVETLPRDDGRFDIVCSVLNNPEFPLLRYCIGDVTEAPLRIPACGYAALARVAGRDNDLIVTRTGRLLHSARIDGLFENEYVDTVRRYRVHQAADGSVTAQVELMPHASVQVGRLHAQLSTLTEGYDVHLELVERVTQTMAAKHRPVSSELYRAAPR